MDHLFKKVPLWIWAVQLGYVLLSLLFLILLLQNMDSGLVSFWGRKLFIVIFVVVMLTANVLWRLLIHREKYILTTAVLLASFIINASIAQAFTLASAHSSFNNYYHFRDCVQLISKSDTTSTCQTASGQRISIVEYKNKWYLSGDVPNGLFGL